MRSRRAPGSASSSDGVITPLELVMFDLDYTLLRPSDQFEAAGYQQTGARFGLDLDVARWPEAERSAYRAMALRRRETGEAHDDGLLEVIARAVIEGMGGGDTCAVAATATAIVEAWSNAENFGLYCDVLPCLRALRSAGTRMVIVSNALGHNIEEVVAHFALDEFVEDAWSSADLGVVKPSPAIFRAALQRAGVAPAAALMVGDSLEDDVEGALACGCRAVLLDRAGRHPGSSQPRLESLAGLPALMALMTG